MTMTDGSLPLSTSPVKDIENQDSPVTYSTSSSPSRRSSDIRKTIYYRFPTPPRSPQCLCTYPRVTSTRSSAVGRRPKRARTTSRTPRASPTHTKRQSSLSTGFHVTLVIEAEFGPPPHPAPTTPLPPIPGAPRVPFTTPSQEWNRYSSYALRDKQRLLEKQRKEIDEKE